MRPDADSRCVDTLRNVLVDELVRDYVEACEEDGGVELVMGLFEEADQAHAVARRLQITFPSPDRLVGMVLQRLSARWLEGNGDQEGEEL